MSKSGQEFERRLDLAKYELLEICEGLMDEPTFWIDYPDAHEKLRDIFKAKAEGK